LPDVAESEDPAAHAAASPRFSRASRTATEAAEAQRRKITGGRKYTKTGAPASTTRENARALLLDGQGASGMFRRFARALTVRIQQATPLSRQRRTALPTRFYLPLSR